jgi:hypothetical protein
LVKRDAARDPANEEKAKDGELQSSAERIKRRDVIVLAKKKKEMRSLQCSNILSIYALLLSSSWSSIILVSHLWRLWLGSMMSLKCYMLLSLLSRARAPTLSLIRLAVRSKHNEPLFSLEMDVGSVSGSTVLSVAMKTKPTLVYTT